MMALGGILILGALAQWLSTRARIPAILPLILTGLFVGPIAEWLFGAKLIDPDVIFYQDEENKPLFWFVSLSVGVILFEGGLTLKFREVRELASTVRNLIFIGALVMWIGGALAAWLVLDMDPRLALLFGSLIIVTGPTVIAPLLKAVSPNKKIATVLKWEGILIDPVGAFVAVLVYELIFVATMSAGAESSFTLLALKTFFLTILVGVGVGLSLGGLFYWILKRDLIPNSLIEVVALAFVIFCFAEADFIAHESGLLSVTVMGVLLANLDTPKLKRILDFKESITILLISILFIILSANIDMDEVLLLGPKSLIVFAIVVLVLRPLAVFLSARRSNLSIKEKIFIAWIGPKGIVAAAVAALFALYLSDPAHIQLPEGMREQVRLLVPLTFMIILGTVTLNGLTAKPLAKLLGVVRKSADGYLIAGANELALTVAAYLRDQGRSVMLVDTSAQNIKRAEEMGFHAVRDNIMSEVVEDALETEDLGNLLALTPANDVNILACRKFNDIFSAGSTFRLISMNEMEMHFTERPDNVLFGGDADFFKLLNIARRHPVVREMAVTDVQAARRLVNAEDDDFIPLFIRGEDGRLREVTIRYEMAFQTGDHLAYIGELPDAAESA